MHTLPTLKIRQIIYILVLSIWLSILAACAQEPTATSLPPQEIFNDDVENATVENETMDNEAVENGYPGNQSTDNGSLESSYPAADETIEDQTKNNNDEAYPGNENYGQLLNREATLLAFSKPVHSQDSSVDGVGPSGLPVHIVNVTFMGNVVGSGTIENDGTFSIVIPPQEKGVQLGLFADLAAVGLAPGDILPGEAELIVPQVGYFFDTLIVTE